MQFKKAPVGVKALLHPWMWPSRPGSISISQAHFSTRISSLQSTHIPSGQRWFRYSKLPPLRRSLHCVTCLARMTFLNSYFQTMVRSLHPSSLSKQTESSMHTRSSPYHPATNGEAERFVRTFKEAMKTGRRGGLTLAHHLDNFLLIYRTTPHSTTGVPPCELLMGRSLHSSGRTVRQASREGLNRSSHLQGYEPLT